MSNLNIRNKYFEEKDYETNIENADKFDLVINENRCSSFKKKGVLCDSCFNSALIQKMQEFSSLERLAFINYQLNKQADPLEWLRRMKAFLYDNEDEFDSFNYKMYLEYQHIIEAGISQLSNTDQPPRKKKHTGYQEFVDTDRIQELKDVDSSEFDLKKLIRYCEEINVCFENEAYLAVVMLTRAILDHIPPIFHADNFQNSYSQNRTKSFKEHMTHLDKSLRKIADSYLHGQIRRKEILPNKTQVNFSQDIDVLLAEICRKIK